MFKNFFKPFKRLASSRLPLISLTILPFYFLQKNTIFATDTPSPPSTPSLPPKTTKPTPPKDNLQIQYAESIPDKIAQYDDQNVIVYFMSGSSQQDDLVKKLLAQYKKQFNQNIHIIFIKSNLEPSSMELHHTFLTKRNYSADINRIQFKNELDKLAPEEFIKTIMKKLEKNIHKLPEINKDTLGNIKGTKIPKVFLKVNKNSFDYKKHRVFFENFMEKPFTFKNIEFMIITDEQAAASLGLESAREGSIHMMIPAENQFLKHENQNQFLKMGGHEYSVIKDITDDQSLKRNFIFMPFINHVSDHILELKINNNKLSKEQKEKLFSIFKDFSQPVHITFSNIPKKYQFYYNKHDDLSYKIFKQELPNIPLDQKIKHLTTSKQWLYKGPFQKQQIQQWIDKVKNGEVEPYYRTEPVPKIDLHSHKLTGKNFQEILVSTDHQVVFYYSENCHGCTKFGEIYQSIAKSNYSDDNLVMNHVNIDKNEMECGYNTPLTPSLSFFKLESKTKPFTYDLKLLSRDGINNFIDITRDVKLVDDELFEKFIRNREGYKYEL